MNSFNSVTCNGKKIESEIEIPRGHYKNPMDDREIESKKNELLYEEYKERNSLYTLEVMRLIASTKL